MGDLRKKYILLQDRVGQTVERNDFVLGLSTKSTPTQVLRGDLLEALPEAEQPQDLTKIALVGVDRKSLRLECTLEYLTKLSNEDANLLLAISSLEERYQTFMDRIRVDFGRKVLLGCKVYVSVKGVSKKLPGIVWYKGELAPVNGTMFGVELINCPGQGTSDGTFRNKRYFTCPTDSGVFVTLANIMPREDPESRSPPKNSIARSKDTVLTPFFKGKTELKSLQRRKDIEKDQRVVAFLDDNRAVRGHVRYIGEQNDLRGNLVTLVGLELDTKEGCGHGQLHGKQLFVCRRDFALFLPIESVIPEKDLLDENPTNIPAGLPRTSKEVNRQEQIHSDELLARSMSYSGDTSDKKSARNTHSSKSVNSAGESSQTDPTALVIEQQRQLLNEVRLSREKDQRQLKRMQEQLREKDRELETSERLPSEREQNLTNFQRQLGEKELQECSLHEQLREKDQQEENLQRQLREIQRQLREKNQQEENSQRQLREIQQQLRQKDQQEENSQRQLREIQQQLREKDQQEENSQRQLRDIQQQLREKDQQEENLQRQLREIQQQLREKDHQEENLQRQLREIQQQLREKDQQKENLQRQLREIQQQLREKDQQKENLQRQLNESEITLSTAQQALSEHQRRQVTPDWVISRDQIQLTDKPLGKGGWGSVVEGKYCGCSVAVKQIHELILSPHNRTLFEREMDIASRCRHPCLLQFIGATNDEGSPLFVTELMESSLRALLEQRPLAATEVSTISLDVARAVNYLHQKTPSPIIHRDISSANVLLWRRGDQWRGKVSDYGTANFMQHTMTAAPGAMIYIAPEALTSKQTVKVDVYSFGVLLCEMCIRELPDPERRDQQIAMVTNRLLRALIRRCLQSDPEARPNMQEIIEELEEPV